LTSLINALCLLDYDNTDQKFRDLSHFYSPPERGYWAGLGQGAVYHPHKKNAMPNKLVKRGSVLTKKAKSGVLVYYPSLLEYTGK
jgi:hypothetical protein